MVRFIYVIISQIPRVIYHLFKMNKWAKDPTKTDEEIRDYTKEIIRLIKKRGRIIVKSQGEENIPLEGGYIMYANHQGKFDGQCVLDKTIHKLSTLSTKKLEGKLLITQFIRMSDGKYIDLENPRSQVEVIKQITEEVKKGKRYLIFPEGIYGKNHNNLQEFKTGCFTPAVRTGCPIIPVCIYDSYKIFNVNSLKKVTGYVFFLKPIYYDEYRDLRKKEIAELVKARINEKLDELKEKERRGETLIND